jgi:hypothetical protein
MDVLLSLKLDGLIKSRNIVVFTASSNQNVSSELRERVSKRYSRNHLH